MIASILFALAAVVAICAALYGACVIRGIGLSKPWDFEPNAGDE